MGVKFNERCPGPVWGENGRKQTEYPWVRGEADVCGGTNFVYANPEKPEDSSSVIFHPDATFTTKEFDIDKKGLTNSLLHENRLYVSGGDSKNTDGHKDEKNHSTNNKDTVGDDGKTTGGDSYNGVGGKRMGGAQEGVFENNSEGTTYKTSKGDVVSEHTGSNHYSLEGDDISSIKGNKIVIISDGEYQTHVQGGNMDTRVEGGKLQIFSGDDMIVNTASKAVYNSVEELLVSSLTKITLRVGDSEIEISSSSITLKVGGKGVKITSSDVSATAPTYTGQPSLDSKTGRRAPPTKFQ
jgi:hypothetical protein